MDGRAVFGKGGSGPQVLGLGVHQIRKGVIVDQGGVNIGKAEHNGQNAEDHDVDLFAEKDAKHAAPVGIAGRGDLLGLQRAVVHMGEQLLIAQPELFQIYKFLTHSAHLAFAVKLMRGSTMDISTSPRIMLSTEMEA